MRTVLRGDTLTLYYRARLMLLGAILLALFSTAFGFGAYFSLSADGIERAIAVSVFSLGAIITGYFSLTFLRTTWRRQREKPYLISFDPQEVRVSLVIPLDRPLLVSKEPGTLAFAKSEVSWIRKSRGKPNVADDEYILSIDLGLSEAAFERLFAEREVFRRSLNEAELVLTETPVRFFEGHVLRLVIEGQGWPKGLEAYWSDHGYPTAPHYEYSIGGTVSNRAAPQNRELL